MSATLVLILSAPACHFCDEAKILFRRLSEEFALQIETRSISDEAGMQLALEHRVLFPPGIFIAGELLQYGRPSERRIRARLAELGAERAALSQP